jgi:hypothetical protein
VVEEGVRTVTDVLIGLSSGVLGLLGGYAFGVLRTLSERRNERRDVALAEIFKEMSLFYRYLGSWIEADNPDPDKLSVASGDIPVKDHVNDQYQKFTYTFYDVNAIWLGKDTYDLIQEFSGASRDFLNELESMRESAGAWRLPDSTNPKDRRQERITPKFYKVRDALRDEVEASRYIIPYRIVIRRDWAGQRRTDPGGGRVVGRRRKWEAPREVASRVQCRGGEFTILSFHPAPQNIVRAGPIARARFGGFWPHSTGAMQDGGYVLPRILILGTGVKIALAARFLWFRGGPPRAMAHFGE